MEQKTLKYLMLFIKIISLWAVLGLTVVQAQQALEPTPVLQGDDAEIYGQHAINVDPLMLLQGEDSEVYVPIGDDQEPSPYARLQGDDREIYLGETIGNPLMVLQGDDGEIYSASAFQEIPQTAGSPDDVMPETEPEDLIAVVAVLPTADLTVLDRYSNELSTNLPDTSDSEWEEIDADSILLKIGAAVSMLLLIMGFLFILIGKDRTIGGSSH